MTLNTVHNGVNNNHHILILYWLCRHNERTYPQFVWTDDKIVRLFATETAPRCKSFRGLRPVLANKPRRCSGRRQAHCTAVGRVIP